jgi:hypothetical protein
MLPIATAEKNRRNENSDFMLLFLNYKPRFTWVGFSTISPWGKVARASTSLFSPLFFITQTTLWKGLLN